MTPREIAEEAERQFKGGYTTESDALTALQLVRRLAERCVDLEARVTRLTNRVQP